MLDMCSSKLQYSDGPHFLCYRDALADARRAVTIKPDFPKVKSCFMCGYHDFES